MAVTKKKVCVIGAGVSGLAAAKVFKETGHSVTLLERDGDLGGVWEPARSYPDVRTQTPKDLYRYTDMAMPAEYPEWPKGPQVHAYLGAYADAHGLRALLRLTTRVEAMERRGGGQPGWRLALRSADDKQRAEDFDFVAVCTGQFSENNLIRHPGQQDFEAGGGTAMHSSEYTDPSMVAAKRVVVLGFSKSATDIAVNAVEAGASAVTIVYREPVWRVPYFIGGLINFKRIFYTRVQESMFPPWGMGALGQFGYAVAKPFSWTIWRAFEGLLKAQLKLKQCGMVPETRVEDTVGCTSTIATPGFYPMIAEGRVKAIRGTFDHYEEGAIIMTGGERVAADLAILAVGWKLGVPFLPAKYRNKLVATDGLYRLYRQIANPDLPDMGFVGFNSSFCSVLGSELAAHWLVRYADGQLARQPTADDMRANIDTMLRWRREERPAASAYGGQCIAPYHFRYFDELLADIGATERRRNPLAERLLPPDADAFRRYLKSAPAYEVG